MSERKRLVRSEMDLLKRLGAVCSELIYVQEDMKDRLKMIDNGEERVQQAIEITGQLLHDLIRTGTEEQVRVYSNIVSDLKLELVPMLKQGSTNVIFTKDQAEKLTQMAQARCRECVLTDDEAKNCELYKVLEGHAVVDKYDTALCPFGLAEWK